jgi:hypothetical protein
LAEAVGIKANGLCSRWINVRTSRICSVEVYSVPQRNTSQRRRHVQIRGNLHTHPIGTDLPKQHLHQIRRGVR